MCGIVGVIDFNKKVEEASLIDMTNELSHRGPDNSGYSFYQKNEFVMGLGHRRLSILDLTEEGNQPFEFENLEMVYNGEVYNFNEIKKELEKEGYTFRSKSDTEVILKAYHNWGIKCVDRFNGMFAISIYDKLKNKVVLIRDRAGVKPLYWYSRNGLIMYSSELKSFHRNKYFNKKICHKGLSLYFQYGYILEPHTIFQDTYKLKAGHYLEIDLKTQNIDQHKYWDVADYYNKPKIKISETEAVEEVDKLFKSAFEYRMVSDVPVGMFLSGGYDSSVVTAVLQGNRKEKLNTFCIGFGEDDFNEAPHAKKIATYLGTNHTEYYCNSKDALKILPELPAVYDEPFADSSSIPTMLVSKIARKDVVVSLSADGGDEIFGGYNKYSSALGIYKRVSKIPEVAKYFMGLGVDILSLCPHGLINMNRFLSSNISRLKKLKGLVKEKSCEGIMRRLQISQLEDLLKTKSRGVKTNFDDLQALNTSNDHINKMLYVDYKTYMVDDILTKIDRATMSVGLEGREPLLDNRIIEFVAQLPSELKYKNGDKKWLLKQVAHRYIPKEMLDRPKQGFGSPIAYWFKEDLKEYLMYYLSEERLDKEGLMNSRKVISLRDLYLKGKVDNNLTHTMNKLWYILMFEMWYDKWMN